MNLSNMKDNDFLWSEFIYGGHWLGIGAIGIVLSTFLLINYPIKWEFLLIIYFGTKCIYNYNHFKELDIDLLSENKRSNHLNKYYNYGNFIVFLYAICYFILLFFFGNFQSIAFGSILLIMGIFFSIGIKDFFKDILGIKLLYTAISWVLIVPFTAFFISYEFDLLLLIFSFFVFLRIIITTTFFDIKDMEIDSKRGLKTIPVLLGKEKCLDILQIINLISIMPIILGISFGIMPDYAFLLGIIFFYSFYYIQKSRSKNIDISNISFILVDGEFYYWPILLLVGFLLLG